MIPIKIELSIFVLLASSFLVSCRPYQRSKRSLVKDYLNPLTYPTTAVKFEKGEDGKYHPQLIDNKVNYSLAKNLEDLNSEAVDVLKSTTSLEDDLKKEKESSKDASVELAKKATDNPLKDQASEEVAKTPSFLPETPKLSEFSPTKSDSKSILDPELGKIPKKSDGNTKSTFSLVKPEDHKLQFQPKPDGKDDQPYELEPTIEEYLPQPPLAAEKKKWTGKLAIGQIPFLSGMPFFGSAVPVFLPERSFSLGVISRGIPPALDVQDRLPPAIDVQDRLPPAVDVQDRLPPAIDVQDRLPMSDAEVLEEGSELSVIENVNPLSGVVRGERRTENHRFRYPFSPFHIPLSTMRKSFKDVMDDQSLQEKSKAQIFDMMGKKMLLQNKVMKYPTDDSSHMYVGVMSVQPLEEVDIETLKKLGLKKEVNGIDKTHRETEGKRREEESPKEKPIPRLNVDQVPINLSEENLSTKNGKHSEKDALEVEESKLVTKNELNHDVAVKAPGTFPISSEVGQHPEAGIKKVQEPKLDENDEIKGTVVEQATGITFASKEEGQHRREDVLKVEESKLNEKKEVRDTVLAEATGITSISKEMVNDKEIKDDAMKDSDKDKRVVDVQDEANLKAMEGSIKKHTESVSEKHEGLGVEEGGKELSKKDLEEKANVDLLDSKKKVIEDSKDEEGLKSPEHAQDSNEDDDDDDDKILLKDKHLIEEKEGKNEEEDFKKFDGALEKKDLNNEDIDLTKIDGVLFAERKKKLSRENKKDASKQKSKKSRKECKCEEDTDIDSDSEDD